MVSKHNRYSRKRRSRKGGKKSVSKIVRKELDKIAEKYKCLSSQYDLDIGSMFQGIADPLLFSVTGTYSPELVNAQDPASNDAGAVNLFPWRPMGFNNTVAKAAADGAVQTSQIGGTITQAVGEGHDFLRGRECFLRRWHMRYKIEGTFEATSAYLVRMIIFETYKPLGQSRINEQVMMQFGVKGINTTMRADPINAFINFQVVKRVFHDKRVTITSDKAYAHGQFSLKIDKKAKWAVNYYNDLGGNDVFTYGGPYLYCMVYCDTETVAARVPKLSFQSILTVNDM